MNVDRRINFINQNMNIFKNEYIKIKKSLSKLFYINCLEKVPEDFLLEIPDLYTNWLYTASDMSEEAVRTHLDIDDYIKECLEKVEKIFKKEKKEQLKALDGVERLVESACSFSTLVNSATNELSILWEKAVKKMRLEPNEPVLHSNRMDNGEYKIVFAGPIKDFCANLIDKEKVEITNLQNDALNRCVMADGDACPVVLENFEIEIIKQLADSCNLKCDFIEWTPENCAHILFENGKAKTVFKELEEDIHLL